MGSRRDGTKLLKINLVRCLEDWVVRREAGIVEEATGKERSEEGRVVPTFEFYLTLSLTAVISSKLNYNLFLN